MANTTSDRVTAFWAVVAIAGGTVANIFLARQTEGFKVAAWLITMAMIVLLCVCIGRTVAGRWDGVLLDSRKRLALSRLQMLAWTLLILSALITAAASNLAAGSGTDALSIDMQNELLAAMGIAAVSLTASPALLSIKDRDPNSQMAANADPAQASWLEMFRGDEAADQNIPDLSKIQQFLITLALVGAYGVAIGNKFHALPAGALFTAFPTLGEKVVWLLGISHASYLTYKATPRSTGTPTPPPPPPPPAPPPPPPPS
jgi:hypothetical protein